MKVTFGTTSLLITAGTVGLTFANPTAQVALLDQLEAREVPNELFLRALFDIKRRAEEHAELDGRAYEEVKNQLYRRWDSGKYTLEDNIYHREVKPKFISEFKSKKFTDYRGSNPNFFIEKDGYVYPSAVAAKQKKDGKCTKREFTKDLGHIVLAAQPRSRSPSPTRKSKRELSYEVDELD